VGRSLPPRPPSPVLRGFGLARPANQQGEESGPGLAPLFPHLLAPERELVENAVVFRAPRVGVHHDLGRIRRAARQPLPGGEL